MTSTKPQAPELFIGLVGAVGTDLQLVCLLIEEVLREFAYQTSIVHLIELLKEIPQWAMKIIDTPVVDRYVSRMDAGNAFRAATGRDDALVLLGTQKIQKERSAITGSPETPGSRRAYVLRSLKHPREVETLRDIYGDGFFLVAAYCPREQRREHLSSKIAGSLYTHREAEHYVEADKLIARDEKEAISSGQNLRDTFPLADVFVDVSRPRGEVKEALERFFALVFGYQFHTPTKDEYAMFHAYAAALRSAELGRQVGAALTDPDGEVIALGTNEVPKAKGGFYWPDDVPDRRDYNLGRDTSDEMKLSNLSELLERLEEKQWLNPQLTFSSHEEKVRRAADVLRGTRVMSPIEFGRAVHAEMAAFMNAARRGVGVAGSTLYTTTFPCHNCTRHIVAAGVERVVFIEPYAKSLAQDLHQDAIAVESQGQDNRVAFQPFVGVAPRQYLNLFRMGVRKNSVGSVATWEKTVAYPRLAPPFNSYLENEDIYVGTLVIP